jgi:single-strand DNA-binding protein
MFNKVILLGNLTRDIELRYTPGGTAVANTAIATSRKFKAQDGTQKEDVCFIDITFFGRTAEIANQYLKRGSKVLVEGTLKFDQWTDQTGGKRSKHSVTVESLKMLDSKNDTNQGGYNNSQPSNVGYQNNPGQSIPNKPQQKHVSQEIPDIDIDDDEIPF